MSGPHQTVVIHPMHGPGLPEALSTIPAITIVAPADDDGVATALGEGHDVLVTFRWEDRFLTDSLRWIQSISAGVDQFPTERLREAGIVLTSARGAHTPAVAEHAIALLLATVRGLGPAMRNASDRAWVPGAEAGEVRDITLGVLGLGSIGEEIARLATALGMTVIGTKRRPADYDGVAVDVLPSTDTREVCERADAIIAALPHDNTPAVGPDELTALGAGWLVNVGRGSAVDERALVEALTDGELRGAGLDVFEVEPLPPESPLWRIPTVILTPHTAWATDRLAPRLAAVFAANLAAHRGGGEWTTRVV